jgi:type VI secretion system protein VasG
MLRGLCSRYETAHKVRILDEAVVGCAKLASRYISGRQLPDKAVDLLDTAAARVKIGLTGKPARLEDVEQRIRTLQRTRGALTRDRGDGIAVDGSGEAELDAALLAAEQERTTLDDRWKREREAAGCVLDLRGQRAAAESDADRTRLDDELAAAMTELRALQGRDPLLHVDVDPEVVAHVVSDWTGIPIGKMVRDEATAVLGFDQALRMRIKGQDHAVDAIARGVRAAKAGLGSPRAPMGVFLLVGPSGVGKTETATGVADLLFGGERFMVTINMSEFQEKHTVSRLIGSPPGYVGFGEGGVLTEAVRQRPYSVVLLDEVEKADPEVMNLFYQVFDKGMLADGEGRVVDFKNTVVFMTSNLASDVVMRMASGPVPADLEEVVSAIRPALNAHFKPALVARMTVVPFFPISAEAMREIARLKLAGIGKRLLSSHRMSFDVDPEVVEQIVQRCTEVETGARNIDHILGGTLLPTISTELLQQMSVGPLPAGVRVSLDAAGEFQLTFGSGAPASLPSAAP